MQCLLPGRACGLARKIAAERDMHKSKLKISGLSTAQAALVNCTSDVQIYYIYTVLYIYYIEDFTHGRLLF